MVRPLHLPAVPHTVVTTVCSRASPSGPIDHPLHHLGMCRQWQRLVPGPALPASYCYVLLLVIFWDIPTDHRVYLPFPVYTQAPGQSAVWHSGGGQYYTTGVWPSSESTSASQERLH